MPGRMLATLVALFLGFVLQDAVCQEKKYDVKSGIITYETLTQEGRVRVAGRIVLYFDQYGQMECKETYVNGMLKESVLCDGRTVYTLWHDQRIVFRRGPATQGTEVRFDAESIPLAERGEAVVRRLPAMTFAGRTCEAYERVSHAGSTKYAGADHIMLYCDRNLRGEEWVMKAVTIDVTSKVPAWKFAPPAGYTERESHF
ncbi:MAG TPA: hypothetical protein VMM80_08295 [Bacteroidota bacterium]|nr:hypothetical protein [Bacteroidota bacterium]